MSNYYERAAIPINNLQLEDNHIEEIAKKLSKRLGSGPRKPANIAEHLRQIKSELDEEFEKRVRAFKLAKKAYYKAYHAEYDKVSDDGIGDMVAAYKRIYEELQQEEIEKFFSYGSFIGVLKYATKNLEDFDSFWELTDRQWTLVCACVARYNLYTKGILEPTFDSLTI